MPKIVSQDIEKIKKGLDTVADAVKITIGPRGKNVAIDSGLHPIIANDGGRIAKEIILEDPIENMGASIIKEVIQRTSEDVGGGRTASAIITQAIVNEGLRLVNKGFNANLLKKGMQSAVKDIHEELDKLSHPIKDKDLESVATISTESEELGKVIADTIKKVGIEGVVTVEEGQTLGISSEVAEGLKFDKGWISPYMVTDTERLEAIYKDIYVMILDKKLNDFGEIKDILDNLGKTGRKELLIFAEDIDESVLRVFAFAKYNGLFKVLAIKNPGIGDNKKYCLEDLSGLTGASIVTDPKKDKIVFGVAKKVVSKKDSTILIGGGDVKTWITTLKTRKELTESKWEIDQFNERIAKLSNGIAVIKVGASSETEIKYLKLKIEDGVNEAKRALEGGIILGGNVSFIHASKGKGKPDTDEESLGYNIVLKAIEAPLRQIVENGGGKPDVIINEIYNSTSNTVGFDSIQNKIVDDMYKCGIIDAVKVVKTVLQNAVSSSSMFLSINATITDKLKDN